MAVAEQVRGREISCLKRRNFALFRRLAESIGVLNKLVYSAFLPIIAIFVIAMSHGSILAKPP